MNDVFFVQLHLCISFQEVRKYKQIFDYQLFFHYLQDLMMARNLKIEPLYDNEVPEITVANQLQKGSLIYRDTLDYLEYLQQVFQVMADLP